MSIALHYTETHVATYQRVLHDAVGIIEHWLEGEADADPEQHIVAGVPSIIRDAESAAQTFRQIRMSEADVLEPELVVRWTSLREWSQTSPFFTPSWKDSMGPFAP